MKFKILSTILLIVLFATLTFGANDGKQSVFEHQNMPHAFLPTAIKVFPQIMEGDLLTHDFQLQNKGDAPLKIEKVRTGCGCAVVSYTEEEILPGGEGIVTVRVNTKGYGGRKISKRATVYTNDKNHPKLILTISGTVEKLAAVRSGEVEK